MEKSYNKTAKKGSGTNSSMAEGKKAIGDNWNHRTMNELDKLPKRLWGQVRKDLRLEAQATTGAECREKLVEIARDLRKAGQTPAAETVLRHIEDFLTFWSTGHSCGRRGLSSRSLLASG